MNGESRGLPPRHMRREPMRKDLAPERKVLLPLIGVSPHETVSSVARAEDQAELSVDMFDGIANPPIPGLVYPEELEQD